MGTLRWCITCIRDIDLGSLVKLIVEVFFRLLHYIVTLYLPVVFGAVATLKGFVLSFLTAVRTSIYLLSISTFKSLNTLYIILEAVAYWAATAGSLQAVFLMQFNLDSSPDICIKKHMPPWRSVSENEGLSSADLAVPPTEQRPKPKIRAFKTNKLSKLVKLSVSTSDVDDALAKNSKAVVTNSVSAILSFFEELSV